MRPVTCIVLVLVCSSRALADGGRFDVGYGLAANTFQSVEGGPVVRHTLLLEGSYLAGDDERHALVVGASTSLPLGALGIVPILPSLHAGYRHHFRLGRAGDLVRPFFTAGALLLLSMLAGCAGDLCLPGAGPVLDASAGLEVTVRPGARLLCAIDVRGGAQLPFLVLPWAASVTVGFAFGRLEVPPEPDPFDR